MSSIVQQDNSPVTLFLTKLGLGDQGDKENLKAGIDSDRVSCYDCAGVGAIVADPESNLCGTVRPSFVTDMSHEAEAAANQAAGDEAIMEAMQAEFDID